MPSEHAPKVAAMSLIDRATWAVASQPERTALLTNAQNEAMVSMVKHAATRHLVPVGAPTWEHAYVAKPGPPVQDLGPTHPHWAFLAVVGIVNTMGVVD